MNVTLQTIESEFSVHESATLPGSFRQSAV